MGNRAVIVAGGLQGHPTSTAKVKQEGGQALHVCGAVGHSEAVPLTRYGLDKDRAPVAGYVYCNPVRRGDRMVRASHWGGLLRKSAIPRMLAANSGWQPLCICHGPEFTSRTLLAWAHTHGIRRIRIEPGKPMQNGYIGSFNGKFRDECLNEQWFGSLSQARECIARWRQDCNAVRPHSGLGRIPPARFAQQHRQRAGGAAGSEQKQNFD